MPVIHQSTIKRARQALKRNHRNRSVLSSVKSVLKKVLNAVEEKKVEAAETSLREAQSALSKAVSKGVLKPNTASRQIARLTLKVNALASARS